MKRISFFLSLMTTVIIVKAQISTVSYHDGYWGKWKSHTTRYEYLNIPPSFEYSIYGNYSGFIIYSKYDHPSEYFFKFQANSYVTPDKNTIKYHLKNNIWYEYSGTVEYYVTEAYPTIEAVLRAYEFPHFTYNSGSSGNPCVKRTANATIKIKPYKERPQCYNICFDGVAVGIDMEDSYFNQ